MKYLNAIAVGAAAVWLVGCASTSRVVLNDPVGPCHQVAAPTASDGFLQVHSARERAPIDLNMQEFFWNNDYGRNEFVFGSALTGYTVFDQDGAVCKQVRRNRGITENSPALVNLAPGHYTVEAEAEDSGGLTVTVVVPLVVQSGQTTTVDLQPAWKRPGEVEGPGHVIALADGRIIGCRAEVVVGQQTRPAALVARSATPPTTP